MEKKRSTFKVKTLRGIERFKSHKNAMEFAKHIFDSTGRVVIVTETPAGGVENTVATFAPKRR